MTTERVPGVGVGVYTHREAALLAGLRPERVARWVRGYRYRTRDGSTNSSAPIFTSDWESRPGTAVTLSFLDLIEMLFVKAFLDEGVSMPTIRAAAVEGARLYQVKHPFCVKQFETDGHSIFVSIEKSANDERLVDLVRKQAVFKQVIRPLLHQLKFNVAGVAAAWWPRGENFPVVLDPARSFGAPIVPKRGVPTRVLSGPVLAGDSPEFVARMYQVKVHEVECAVTFERELAAAA